MEVENSPLEDCSTLQPNSFLLLVARPGAPFVASLLLETGGGSVFHFHVSESECSCSANAGSGMKWGTLRWNSTFVECKLL